MQIRYGDLDPQWHVNNSRALTFIEQARFDYLRKLELWDGQDFFKIGLIVADVHVAYLAPMYLGQSIEVRLRVARMGNKSLTFEYEMVDVQTEEVLTRADTIMVSYDYVQKTSMPIPDAWRKAIGAFEGME